MVIINSTEFGSITVDGKTYYNDIIITWNNEVKEVHLTVRHYFGLTEFNRILSKKPDLLIVGTGDSDLCKVSDEVRKLCRERGIELLQMISRKAIEKFNETFNQEKKVVAFIHVTC
jgi:hypothetical protein